MTSFFSLHKNLSAKAHAQLGKAVTLDEQQLSTIAVHAYDSAIKLLLNYLHVFASPRSSSFQGLSPAEQQVVMSSCVKVSSILKSAQNRHAALSSTTPSSGHHPPIRSQPRPAPAVPSTEHAASKGQSDPLRNAIESEILDASPDVQWDDIYGLADVKSALNEMLVLPAKRPDLYTGLRASGRGVLLFGPPGTGKTLIAKAVATNINATFFSISASSLMSKFHGESERLVRTLFQIARERQPSFIFIDEVDSILGARSDNEHEASRRLKTEFMSQFDGATTNATSDDRVYVMAASNRPQDLDDAVRRRLDRRIFVPLPDAADRVLFFRRLTAKNAAVNWALSDADMRRIARRADGFSGSDIKALCREASLMPLRELGPQVSDVRAQDVRACDMRDFDEAFSNVRPSSNAAQIAELERWNEQFGSKARHVAKPCKRASAPAPVSAPAPASSQSDDEEDSGDKVVVMQPGRRVTRSVTAALKARGLSHGQGKRSRSYLFGSRKQG